MQRAGGKQTPFIDHARAFIRLSVWAQQPGRQFRRAQGDAVFQLIGTTYERLAQTRQVPSSLPPDKPSPGSPVRRYPQSKAILEAPEAPVRRYPQSKAILEALR